MIKKIISLKPPSLTFRGRFSDFCSQSPITIHSAGVDFSIEFSFHQKAPLSKLFRAPIRKHGEIVMQAKLESSHLYAPVALLITDSEFSTLELSFLQKQDGIVSGSAVRNLVYEMCTELNVPKLQFCDDSHIDLGSDHKWPLCLTKKLLTGIGFYPNAELIEGKLNLDNKSVLTQSNSEFESARELLRTCTLGDMTSELLPVTLKNLQTICKRYAIADHQGFIELISTLETALKSSNSAQLMTDCDVISRILKGEGFKQGSKLKEACVIFSQSRYFQVNCAANPIEELLPPMGTEFDALPPNAFDVFHEGLTPLDWLVTYVLPPLPLFK